MILSIGLLRHQKRLLVTLAKQCIEWKKLQMIYGKCFQMMIMTIDQEMEGEMMDLFVGLVT